MIAIHAEIIVVPIFAILIRCDETFGIRLTTYHNLYFLLKLMEQVRQAIREDRLGGL